MTLSTTIVGYLLLFGGVGMGFVLFNIVLGMFLRPNNPSEEKQEIYECGEPTIGSSFVQFDLRFYVVALLFIIFDVEVAFFFPWAVVFGKSAQLSDPSAPVVNESVENGVTLAPAVIGLHREFGLPESLNDEVAAGTVSTNTVRDGARSLLWTCLADIGVFFAVLLMGFAYVWKRGDLDWVRAITEATRAGPESAVRSTTARRQQAAQSR
ncbi:NADH-quinone oxidoreductase subunit A [Blastopirellula sp. JC732]|uniref:NADH-quinone oxidoreductase subunit n=1 Tax=Blastopirellula sediminis TaxID=2894196 RepID=A0A9X1MLJ1_9BACT|nr:NADH-quinone oxidoreductase subunit A [Blastopirellula sediminis]MCC9629061.1 NADH-quinone oxidoreductase subunit A [Blastopirellula sediminis]